MLGMRREQMTTTYSSNRALFNDLAALLTGQLFFQEDTAYEPVRQLWNGKVTTRPTVIVRCLSVQDVKMPGGHEVMFSNSVGLAEKIIVAGRD
jgi:hypothetical protein